MNLELEMTSSLLFSATSDHRSGGKLLLGMEYSLFAAEDCEVSLKFQMASRHTHLYEPKDTGDQDRSLSSPACE